MHDVTWALWDTVERLAPYRSSAGSVTVLSHPPSSRSTSWMEEPKILPDMGEIIPFAQRSLPRADAAVVSATWDSNMPSIARDGGVVGVAERLGVDVF